ncbi:hypothetical protein E2I00_014571, partial [Balaenoptera physalus]
RTLSWVMSSVYYRGIPWTSIYYWEFEDTEENKLTSTPIFNECISLYIEQLLERIPGFNMAAFTTTLQHRKDEVAGDIFDMLLTFTDFLAFKEIKRRPRTGLKLRLSGDFIAQIIFIARFPEQYAAPSTGIILDITGRIDWERLWLMMSEEYISERLTVLQPFINVKY